MTADSILLVGTSGQAVWRSEDSGNTFRLSNGEMFMEAEVRALALDPSAPSVVYAGTDGGLYRSDDAGKGWTRLELPFDTGQGWQAGTLIWSVLVDPHDTKTLFVGTCPGGVYRTRDGGAAWQKLDIPVSPTCDYIRYSRVTCLVADPEIAGHIWAGIEIGGLWHSTDGGDKWTRQDEGMSSADIHGFAILPATITRPKTLLATTNNDLNRSIDGGATWQPQNITSVFPHRYCRGIAQKADDPQTVFVGNGSGPPDKMAVCTSRTMAARHGRPLICPPRRTVRCGRSPRAPPCPTRLPRRVCLAMCT